MDTWRCGMALHIVSDNDLINNKKLAFTTLTRCGARRSSLVNCHINDDDIISIISLTY